MTSSNRELNVSSLLIQNIAIVGSGFASWGAALALVGGDQVSEPQAVLLRSRMIHIINRPIVQWITQGGLQYDARWVNGIHARNKLEVDRSVFDAAGIIW